MTTMVNQAEISLRGLTFLWLEITSKCNLTCSHCYADASPARELYGNLTYPDWLCVLDQAAELGCRRVQFIGGEPTLHPRLPELVEHAGQRGFHEIEVFTNATRLHDGLINCFTRNRVQVATSFYADDAEVHDGVTEVAGSWQRTVRGIRAVVAAGIPIRVGVIETDRNQGHADRAMDFVRSLGVEHVGLDRERGVGRGAPYGPAANGEPYDELCGHCWQGKLCVTPSGEAFPCVFARAACFALGNVKAGLAELIQGAKLAAFRSEVRMRAERPASTGTASCAPNEMIIPCWPDKAPCYPDQPCSPKNPCWPDKPPCWPDKPPDPPPCTPTDPCMPRH